MNTTTITERKEMVQENSSLVKSIVDRIRLNFDPNYLIGIGTAAFEEAAHEFDDETWIDFKSYATMRIRSAILDEIKRINLIEDNVS